MALRQPVVKGIEDEADPEVLLDIARQRVEAVGRRLDYILPILVGQRKKALEALARHAVI